MEELYRCQQHESDDDDSSSRCISKQREKSVVRVECGGNEDAERLSADLALFLSNPALNNALADGSLDLASYSSTMETELAGLERECISIYRDKAADMASLRGEMEVCDAVLSSLQEMLLGFQADLGSLSGDIQTLQEQSNTLGVQLRNRRDAELGLRIFLEQIVVPPDLIRALDSPVDSNFLQCVRMLEHIHRYVHITQQDVHSADEHKHGESARELIERTSCGIPPASTPAGTEMAAHLEKLRWKAVANTRAYFLQTIAELRRPKTNVRMIQVNSLLKYVELNHFLCEAAPDVAMEIRDVYAESMDNTCYALFRTYAAQLARLDNKIATRNDVIAIEDAKLRDAFSTKVNMTKRGDAFFLGDRALVLESSETSTPIVAHVAIAENLRYPYEMIFRSLLLHLIDAATNEYVFIRQFFQENGPDAFPLIFSRTLSFVLEQLENYLFNCYDCLGLLLMIKLVHGFRRTMKQRKVNSLDKFFDSVTNLLWPRLKAVMDKQLRSVRDGDAKRLGFVAGNSSTGTEMLHAHYVSRRYAEFTCSLLLILNKGNKVMNAAATAAVNRESFVTGVTLPVASVEDAASASSAGAGSAGNASSSAAGRGLSRGSAGDMLMRDLSLLQNEIVSLLERLSEEHTTNKKRIVFLINNLDQIISIFQERRVVTGREMNRFAELLMQQRELFVEEELLQSFSKMIAFVQQTEQHMLRGAPSRGGPPSTNNNNIGGEVNVQVVESLVREFSSTWKHGIEQINRNVLSYFSNFRNGTEILKQVLTQLLLYYTRFQDIIRKIWRSKPPAFCKDLVSTTVILTEIKKFALAI